MPYGTDGMNDIVSWKTIRAGNTGFTREATAEQPTLTGAIPVPPPGGWLRQRLRRRSTLCGGIDDRVDALVPDVSETGLDLQSSRNVFCLSRFNIE